MKLTEPNIDVANHRINALEAKMKLPKSDFIEDIHEANAWLTELESKQAELAPRTKSPAPSNEAKELAALNEQIRVLANCCGFSEVGTYTSVESAKARLANLEKLRAERNQPKPAPKVEPVKLPNDLAAIKKSGKVFGLGKAMIAAHEQAHQKR